MRSSAFEWLARACFIAYTRSSASSPGSSQSAAVWAWTPGPRRSRSRRLCPLAAFPRGARAWARRLRQHARPDRSVRQRHRLRRPLRPCGRDPAELTQRLEHIAQDGRRPVRMDRRHVAGRSRRDPFDRGRHLPGLPRRQSGLPRGFEDRGNGSSGSDMARVDRIGRPCRARSRFQPRRCLPREASPLAGSSTSRVQAARAPCYPALAVLVGRLPARAPSPATDGTRR